MVLQGDDPAENVLGAFESVGLAAVEQRDGILKRITGGVNKTAFQCGVVSG